MTLFALMFLAVILGMLAYDALIWLVSAGIPKLMRKLERWKSEAIGSIHDRT